MPSCAAVSKPARPRSTSFCIERVLGATALLAGLALGPEVLAREIRAGDMAGLPPANIVILGEVHDNPQHHLNQAKALTSLRPKAIVFEMLSPEQAEIVNQRGLEGEALEAALDWDDSGWPDFALYAPVFAAVGQARVYGMAVPRDDARRAMTEGAAAVFGPEAKRYGLAAPLPDAVQAEREADQQDAHCNALPPEALPGMVEAQRLRDAAFARTILEAYDANGGPVAVITGTGHARDDWGIPAVLRKAAPGVIVLTIGQLEQREKVKRLPYTHWLMAMPAERADPCAAFDTDGTAVDPSDGGG